MVSLNVGSVSSKNRSFVQMAIICEVIELTDALMNWYYYHVSSCKNFNMVKMYSRLQQTND